MIAERKPAKKTVKATGTPTRPKFKNADAARFWDQTIAAYDGYFGEEDTPILILAAEAWARYRELQNAYSGVGSEVDDARADLLLSRWFDKVYKMLVALGLTPCQRKNLNVPQTYNAIGSVERRGTNGDDEEEGE